MTSSRREAGNARQKRMHPLVLPASSSQRTLISSIMFRIKHHHGLKSSSVTTTFAASCHRLSYATSAIFIAISGPERPIGTPPDMRVRLRRWGGVEQSISQARASHQTSVPSEPSNVGSERARVPGLSLPVANASGNRDDEHNSQGTVRWLPKSDIAGQTATGTAFRVEQVVGVRPQDIRDSG
jgi:hypothetical protein